MSGEVEIGDDDGSLDAALVRLGHLRAEAEDLVTQGAEGTSTALVPTSAGLPAETVKRQMATARASLVHKRAEIETLTREIQERLRHQLAEHEAILGPMRKQVARLEEGIETVNLFLGVDEEIVALNDTGELAPAGTPITVRQMVLSMDQEAMVAADRGGIDANDIESFDRWLLASPDHLTQVLPEPKGVVVLVPRRTPREYKDPWEQREMDRANAESYWLLRNGDRLWRMWTPFNVGKRVIPLRDEFTGFFERSVRDYATGTTTRVPLEPGSREWLEAEERAGARQRHYMKAALILEGLIQRVPVFHPLPDPAVSFINPDSYDAGWVNIISDADLALGTGKESFRDWQKRLNSQLRPGMRIVGAFNGEEFRGADTSGDRGRYGHSRISPSNAPNPPTGELLTIEDRKANGDLVIRFERSDKRWGYEHGDWGRWGDWPFKQRASCVLRAGDRFVIPFDLVTVAELEAFISSRGEREDYLALMPILQAAVKAKATESAAEAPFRKMLAGTLANANNVTIPEAEEVVGDLVDWFKLTNRHHRPLVDPDPALQAKAIRLITAEHARRIADNANSAARRNKDSKMVPKLLGDYPDALLVARRRDGKYAALTPADDRNVFVHRHVVGVKGAAKTDQWVLPGTAWKSWTTMHTAARWEQWDHGAALGRHLTGPELDALVAEIIDSYEGHEDGNPVAVTQFTDDHYENPGAFLVWLDGYAYKKPKRPLTDNTEHPYVRSFVVRWKRTTGNKVELVLGRGWHGRNHHWSDKGPWHDQGDKAIVVWEHENRIAKLGAKHAKSDADAKEHRRMFDRSWKLANDVVQQWKQAQEQAAFERFIADFLDPELWEGQRKTLRFEFPNDHRGGSFRHMLERLVESGVDPEGMTVADAHAAYLALSSKERKVTIPEGAEHLVFHAPDEEQDDED